jgi:diacylglycerol kinase
MGKNSKFWKGFANAFAGIRDTYKTEPNFKFHCIAMVFAVLLGFFLSLSIFEWLWILLAIALVLGMELMNTALEALSDLVSPEYNPLIKKAKDAAAAAVLILSVFAFLVGLTILVPKIWFILIK